MSDRPTLNEIEDAVLAFDPMSLGWPSFEGQVAGLRVLRRLLVSLRAVEGQTAVAPDRLVPDTGELARLREAGQALLDDPAVFPSWRLALRQAILAIEDEARNDALDAVAAAVEGAEWHPHAERGTSRQWADRGAILDAINAARPK